MEGRSIRGRIIYDRIEESTLRSNNTFMSMGYAEKASTLTNKKIKY